MDFKIVYQSDRMHERHAEIKIHDSKKRRGFMTLASALSFVLRYIKSVKIHNFFNTEKEGERKRLMYLIS